MHHGHGEAGPDQLAELTGDVLIPLIPRLGMGVLQKVVVIGGNGFVGTFPKLLQ